MVREVPPVERVRPGLWSVPVPIPNNPLGYTLVYLFETDRGPVLVDSGWDDDTSWKVLQEGFATTGHAIADCYGVLVTHMHPDHHGLSGRVRDASGAWVAMHPQDAFILQRRFEIDDEWLIQAAAILLDSGAPDEAIASLPTLDAMGRMKPPVLPDRGLSDGERVDIPGWDVHAVWTPGHSPGHTCFNVDRDVLLSGDHVLPEITPHIGLYRIDDEQHDPLGDYMHSLLRVSAEIVNEVLPAHQHRFHSLPRRVGELLAHHEERLDAIERSLLVRPETSWDVAAAMPWNRAWDDLGIIMKRTALSEAFAHIRYLEHQGRVERTHDGTPISWQLTAARADRVAGGIAVVDFEFSPEQEAVREAVRRFLRERAPIAYVRGVLDDDRGTTDAVWRGLAELGVTGLLVPEHHGGAGMGMVDAGVVLEELGRAVYPGPFLSSAVAAVSTVLEVGSTADHDDLLPGLADGSIVGTLALLEPDRRASWRDPEVRAEADRLSGTKIMVPDAGAADTILVGAACNDGLGVFAVDVRAQGVLVIPTPTVDGTRKHRTVVLDDAPARRLGTPGADTTAAVARVIDRVLIALVVDGIGSAEVALEMAVTYAKERTQFDRPIGSFQAVQHLCADMLQSLELGRAGAYYALWAADAGDPKECHRAATMAKAFAGDAFARIGASAIQVFGGIGFTWEHDIHLFYKRLLTLQQALGTSNEHLDELASLIL